MRLFLLSIAVAMCAPSQLAWLLRAARTAAHETLSFVSLDEASGPEPRAKVADHSYDHRMSLGFAVLHMQAQIQVPDRELTSPRQFQTGMECSEIGIGIP